MIHRVTSTDMGDYLLVTAEAVIESLEEWKELDRMESAECARHDHAKVITDERAVVHPDNLAFVQELVQHMLVELPESLRQVRLAVVVHPRSMHAATCWEAYCVNRGFNCRAFTSMDSALAYVGGEF